MLRFSQRAFGSRCFSSSSRPQLVKTIQEVRQLRDALAREGKSVGFVPTMGALHPGHLSLAQRSKSENDKTFVSVFVNPLQFAPHEDFDRYPRQLERDMDLLSNVQADFVFAPDRKEMYPDNKPHATFVNLEGIDSVSEGSARPGFFRGVATVVTKLFNIVQPTRAYFGQKDGVQVMVIKRMVRDLNIATRVVVCPTMREPDGVAMSSRNAYLSPGERAIAPVVFQSLQAAEQLHDQHGEREVAALKRAVERVWASEPRIKPQYVSISDTLTGAELAGKLEGPAMLSVAVTLGKTRLIDNILLGKEVD